MKKLIYILLSCLLAGSLSAQEFTLQKELNMPRTGDSFEKEEFLFDSTVKSTRQAKSLKEVWDFSKSKPVEKERTYTYVLEDGTVEKVVEVREIPYVAYYASETDKKANRFAEAGNTMHKHRSLSSDSLLDYGYENSGSLVRYHTPGLVVRYPLEYGDRCFSSFAGRGLHWQRLESENTGTITSHADGFGSLILPSGDTLTSVLRLHIHKEEFVRYSPAKLNPDIDSPLKSEVKRAESDKKALPDDDFQLNVTDTYQWYEYGFRYPVFETVSSYTKVKGDSVFHEPQSFVFYPSTQRELGSDKVNEAIEEQLKKRSSGIEAMELQLHCYSNPIREELTIELYYDPGKNTLINLYSSSGILLHKETPQSPDGYYQTRIDMSPYLRGSYIVHVQSGSEQISQKINK